MSTITPQPTQARRNAAPLSDFGLMYVGNEIIGAPQYQDPPFTNSTTPPFLIACYPVALLIGEAMVLSTSFTKAFNLSVPVCLAPMAGVSGGRLAGE